MARKAQADAQSAFNTNKAAGSQAGANSENIYSSLEPQLMGEATNPQGYGTNTVNQMKTGVQQELGGSTAGITGQANLGVARTRNSGGYNAALDQGAANAGQTGSEANLGIDTANAQLKQQQQQQGLSALGNLGGQQLGAEESFYGDQPATVNALTNAGSQGWLQNATGILGALGGLGGGVGAAAKGFGA
jgi:hypothetical protein